MANLAISGVPFIDSAPVPVSFNQEQFRQDLQNTASVIGIFKKAIEEFGHQLDSRFVNGENTRNLIYERARFIDTLLHYAWHQSSWTEDSSLIAVGGYGRGELHPQSDIDLLILLPENATSDADSAQQFLTLLWDIGLNIGHSVRTLPECLDIAHRDLTVVTSIMEARLLQGQESAIESLKAATAAERMWPNEPFFLAKIEEQTQRHHKYNDIEYNLEPNVKNAPGGLRDIQTIQWVAKRFFKVTSLSALEGKGFFTEAEFATLNYGEEFLWKVRYGLHMVANRPEERLLFDYQKELAKLFGYEDKNGQLAIEQFMHEYYRIVLSLRELNDVLLQFLDEAIINRGSSSAVININERFQLRDNFIEVTHIRVFEETPSALLEIFVLAAQNKNIIGFRASTIRLIRESRSLIDEKFRNDPLNNRLFLALLQSPYYLVSQLKRMKRYGILGRYLPEFDRIIGQMQHDLFHIYTVDDHTLTVIEFMRRFLLPDAREKFPLTSSIAQQLPKLELLYIAGLYHDIAKGRNGDHSILGAVDVKAFGKRHQLSKKEINLVSWLVEQHLAMSSTSQKQDLSDPEVIHNFAKLVGDQLHLDYLYVLTVADMNGTNPDIWNNWRATLLQQLYNETKRALRRGLENPIDKEELIAETQEQAMAILLNNANLNEQAIWELWQTAGEAYFLREKAKDIAWHTEAILSQDDSDQPLILIADHTWRNNYEVTQIFMRTQSKKNIFAAATSALDNLNLDIQDARIYTTVSGYTMDTFYVLSQDGLPVEQTEDNTTRIIEAIRNEISLSDQYSDIIKRRIPRQLKHFGAPTRTSISNDLSQEHTILEVITPDRTGVLARIARIFVEYHIQIITAKITTLGERVEDIFFITDKDGNRLSDPNLCDELQQRIRQELDDTAADTKNH